MARLLSLRFRANVAHIRQSRPDSGLGFQVKGSKPLYVAPSSLGSGRPEDLVFNADRVLYHSTLGSRVIKKKKKEDLSSAWRAQAHAPDLRLI